MSLKGTKLAEYNRAMPKEDLDKALEENFEVIRKALNFTGVKNLVEVTQETELQITGTAAEQVVPGFSKAFQSSGGFIEVSLNGLVYFNGASGIALYIDDRRVDWCNSHSSTHLSASLRWDGPLGAGRHKVDVRVASSGGHVIELSHDDSKTRLTVRETLL